MSTFPRRYYKVSGRIAVTAPFRLLWPGALPTAVLAAIYTLVIRYNPFIYLSCVATVLFGVSVALMASMATEEGKSRSIYFDFFATSTLVLFALWVHWLTWIMLTVDGGGDLARRLLLAGPATWSDALQDMSRHYHLTLSRRISSQGAEATSENMLWLWGVEASLITLTALICCKWLGMERVYCEQSDTWTKMDLRAEFDNVDLLPDQLRLALEQNNYEALQNLQPIHPEKMNGQSPWKSLELKFRSATAEQSSCFISISAVDNTWNGKGNHKQVRTSVVHNLLVPPKIYRALLARLQLVIASKDKEAVVALPQIGAHQKYGLELTTRFGEWLVINKQFYISHRDASCMGFELMPDGSVLYRQYDDGSSWADPEKCFVTMDEFVQWLAQKSDRILAAESSGRANPVTHKRIQSALSGQVDQTGY